MLKAARVALKNGVDGETFEDQQQLHGSGAHYNSDVMRAYREAETEAALEKQAEIDINNKEDFAEFLKEQEAKMKDKSEKSLKNAEITAKNAWS